MAEFDRQTIISFPNSELQPITTGIEAGSLNVSEILLNNGLNFGECNSNKFEAVVYDIQDITGQKIYVYQIDGEENEISIFTGYVQSCKLDQYGYYREIIAYDILSMYANDLAVWWNAFWDGNPVSTIHDLRVSLCTYIGVVCEDENLFNDDFAITETMPINSLKLQDILKHIGQITLTNPNITRDGKLQFVKLYDTNVVDITDNYEGGNTSFEELSTRVITQVRVVNSKTNVYADSGVYSCRYTLSDNIFLYDRDGTQLQAIADSMYSVLHALPTYLPADIKMIVSNMNIHVGDFVETEKGISLICENTFSGSMLVEQDLKSVGLKEQEEKENTALVSQQQQEQLSKIEGASTQYYVIVNAKSITIANENRRNIIRQRYVTVDDSLVIFHAQILCHVEAVDAELPSILNFTYRINDAVVGTHKPVQTLNVDGMHIIHLMYAWKALPQVQDRFTVELEAENCTIQIDAYDINGYICGRGLAVEAGWNGLIELDDVVEVIDMCASPVTLRDITTNFDIRRIRQQEPLEPVEADFLTGEIQRMSVGEGIALVGIEATVGFGKTIRKHTWGYLYDNNVTWSTLDDEYIW